MYILSQEELQEDINTLKELELKYKLHEVQALKIGDLETYDALQEVILGVLTAEVRLGDLLIARKRAELEFMENYSTGREKSILLKDLCGKFPYGKSV